MNLFRYAICFVGPEKKDKDGNVLPRETHIIKDVTSVIANDEATVRVIAAREIHDDYIDRLSCVKILVHPF